MTAMKLVPNVQIMEHPPLPEEVSAMVDAAEFLAWLEEITANKAMDSNCKIEHRYGGKEDSRHYFILF